MHGEVNFFLRSVLLSQVQGGLFFRHEGYYRYNYWENAKLMLSA